MVVGREDEGEERRAGGVEWVCARPGGGRRPALAVGRFVCVFAVWWRM